jgi:hypothetical protein
MKESILSVVSQVKRYNRKMKTLGLAVLAVGFLAAGFWLGRSTAPQPALQASLESRGAVGRLQLVQNQPAPQAPNDPRELIPLNPNGQGQQPGQGQGQQPQPGQGQAPEDCPIMIYQDGQLFTFPRPGQEPGQQPGQGQGNQPGQPGGAQELLPLNPNAPSTPNSPNTPSTPSRPILPNNPNAPTPRS